MTKTLIITGGHPACSIAILQELLHQKKYKIYYYGRKYAFSRTIGNESFEYQEVEKLSVPFIESNASRFPHSLNPIALLVFFIAFLLSFIRSLVVTFRIHPHLIISFGGYVGAPMIAAGWLRRIPIVIHEQTMSPGRSNMIFSYFAQRVFVSWKNSIDKFPKRVQKKCIVVGNPVRKEVREAIKNKKIRKCVRTIYVTGGSTGAHRINHVIYKIIPRLLQRYKVIHQCGKSEYNDYKHLLQLKSKLPHQLSQNYTVRPYYSGKDLYQIFMTTDIIIGRSGANSIIEIANLKIPSILIPLPESIGNEQNIQANLLEKHGTAIVISQDKASPMRIIRAIEKIRKNYSQFCKYAEIFAKKKNIALHKEAHKRFIYNISYFDFFRSI